ncbi:chlorohydrolase family protein [Cladophialophora carrionii]|uniref:Chlorohydrolase family protein n=1 Tax=Cladophialophora carrionii TaxID=86049 RepID=A0A1C1CH98_9EURO|nr:chlorohydrolase family protein [Cladophialophora carrionii]
MFVQSTFLALLVACFASSTIAQNSSFLFHGATIIAFNESSSKISVLRNSSLLVRNDRVAGLFENSVPSDLPKSTEYVDITGKMISPGFINTHHHLWQTAFKTLASNTTLAEYVQRYGEFSPAVNAFEPNDIYLGQLAGSLELLHAGTTTVLDHAHGDFSNEALDAALNATLDSGIRTFFAPAIHDLSLINGYSIEDQKAKLLSLVNDTRLQNNDVVSLGLAYDRFAQASEEELLERYGALNTSTPVVLSHASFISAIDMQLLRETKQYISTTPESEFHYGHLHSQVRHIQDQASLGVDTHFTFSSDMVGQARLWLQALRADSFRLTLEEDLEIPYTNPMSVEQAFLLITRNGALALRRPDIGIIAVGAKADLVVFDGSSPNLLGWDDPIAAVILHSNVGDISDVVVNGKFVKRDGKLAYSDYAAVRQDFLRSAKKIQNAWKEMEFGPLESNPLGFGITPYAQPRQIDVQAGPGTGY